MNITKVKSLSDIKKLAKMASSIWHEYFTCIISEAQIDYMIEKFQSEAAINEQLKKGYRYFFIEDAGYFGVQTQDEKLFLSKLYIKSSERGKGYSRKAFEFMKELCAKENLKSIYLTCNKYNENSLAVYKKFGFVQIDSVVSDIGQNFVMDDYILEFLI